MFQSRSRSRSICISGLPMNPRFYSYYTVLFSLPPCALCIPTGTPLCFPSGAGRVRAQSERTDEDAAEYENDEAAAPCCCCMKYSRSLSHSLALRAQSLSALVKRRT